MVELPLWELVPVELEVSTVPDCTEWTYLGYRFRWGKSGLLVQGSSGWSLLAAIHAEPMAVQFSVGYVAGRRLTWGPHDILRVVEG